MLLSLQGGMDFGLTGFGFGDTLKLLEKGLKLIRIRCRVVVVLVLIWI